MCCMYQACGLKEAVKEGCMDVPIAHVLLSLFNTYLHLCNGIASLSLKLKSRAGL
jgi:hypothetical protein